MRPPKLKLILCSDWKKLIAEINRQLKCHGFIVKAQTKREWADQLLITVEHPKPKRPNFGKL